MSDKDWTFAVDENHEAYAVDLCPMCGQQTGEEHHEHMIHPQAQTQIASVVRYLADSIDLGGRLAPAIILLKVVHPEITVREIGKALGVKKSSVSEVITKASDRMGEGLAKVLRGTCYHRSISQAKRRERERASGGGHSVGGGQSVGVGKSGGVHRGGVTYSRRMVSGVITDRASVGAGHGVGHAVGVGVYGMSKKAQEARR